MKIKLIVAAVLILTVSLLVACSDEKTEPTTAAPTTLLQTTTSATTTTLPVTTEPETLTTEQETTSEIESTKLSKPATTVKVTKPAVTVAGRVYTDNTVERVRGKYGVIINKYKKIYYQMIDDEKVIVDSEYTSYSYIRREYEASYDELLPAARENRSEYSGYISEILKILNGYRAEKGVAPLRLNDKLTVMSCVRAEEIAWSGVQGHTRPDGRKCFSIFKEAGFEEGTAGENLGYGFWTPEEVCQAWKDSRTHYNNIINPKFKQIGIGVAADPDERGKLVWATHFLSE